MLVKNLIKSGGLAVALFSLIFASLLLWPVVSHGADNPTLLATITPTTSSSPSDKPGTTPTTTNGDPKQGTTPAADGKTEEEKKKEAGTTGNVDILNLAKSLPGATVTLDQLFSGGLNAFITIIAIGAFLSLIYSGFMYITSSGDEAKAETARKNIVWSLTGVILTILSMTIITFVAGLPSGSSIPKGGTTTTGTTPATTGTTTTNGTADDGKLVDENKDKIDDRIEVELDTSVSGSSFTGRNEVGRSNYSFVLKLNRKPNVDFQVSVNVEGVSLGIGETESASREYILNSSNYEKGILVNVVYIGGTNEDGTTGTIKVIDPNGNIKEIPVNIRTE